MSTLTIEAGATLNTGDCVVYYESLSNSGSVDNPANLIELAMTSCPADFNGDSTVDSGDLAILLASWNASTADLNDDDVTDSTDLAILLAAWGVCP